MQKGYTGADRALQYLFAHATATEAIQTLISGTEIARLTIDGEELVLYAPTPQAISAAATLQSGTEIGSITINDQTLTLYAPASKGITVASGKVSLT